jgi:hypothetical protein
VALVPAAGPEAPDRHPEPVAVFESSDPFAISLAKGSLGDADIPFWMQGDETASRLALIPISFPPCRLLVPKDREAEARMLLEPLRSPQGGSSP